jgi:serine phosphatase RsbU (regulator of sigma subunit)
MNLIDEISEIKNFQKIAKNIKPGPGEIPDIPGLDIYGETISLIGDVCGDHIIYVDFMKRFNISDRINEAVNAGRTEVADKLRQLENKAGIMLSDVSGHSITDHLLNAMLHQSFLLGASYELTYNGEITTHLFEGINQRFHQSSSIDKFITLIYGEIENNGDFKFVSAGHPLPLVFSNEYNRIVNIDDLNLVNFPPIGTLPSESDIDGRNIRSMLGYKKRYSINTLNVMGHGDILLLFTDGFTEQSQGELNYVSDRLENLLMEKKHLTAKEIFFSIKDDFLDYCISPDDDATMILLKRI